MTTPEWYISESKKAAMINKVERTCCIIAALIILLVDAIIIGSWL